YTTLFRSSGSDSGSDGAAASGSGGGAGGAGSSPVHASASARTNGRSRGERRRNDTATSSNGRHRVPERAATIAARPAGGDGAMDLSYGPEAEAVRRELRAFLDEHRGRDPRGGQLHSGGTRSA